MPAVQIEEDTDRDRYMSPLEAMQYGLIDNIVGGEEVGGRYHLVSFEGRYAVEVKLCCLDAGAPVCPSTSGHCTVHFSSVGANAPFVSLPVGGLGDCEGHDRIGCGEGWSWGWGGIMPAGLASADPTPGFRCCPRGESRCQPLTTASLSPTGLGTCALTLRLKRAPVPRQAFLLSSKATQLAERSSPALPGGTAAQFE